MKRWVPWAIGGGALGVGVLWGRMAKTVPDAEISQAEIDRLMNKAVTDGAFDRLVDDLVKSGSPPEVKKKTYAGPLEILIDIKASGFEKFFAGDITPDVKKVASKIAPLLPKVCPGSPALASLNPTLVKLSDTSQGFKVRLVWPAVWSSEKTGPVRPAIAQCMEQLVKDADKKLGARMLTFSASRIA